MSPPTITRKQITELRQLHAAHYDLDHADGFSAESDRLVRQLLIHAPALFDLAERALTHAKRDVE